MTYVAAPVHIQKYCAHVMAMMSTSSTIYGYDANELNTWNAGINQNIKFKLS